MKLKFGKKALALLLMLTVALSLCTVSAWATEGGTTYLLPGKTTTIAKPAAAAESAVSWTSSSDACATVSNGVVTAVAKGTATITASWGESDSDKATYSITVLGREDATSVTLKDPAKASYFLSYGSTFSASDLSNIQLEINYGHDLKETVTASWSTTGTTELTNVNDSQEYTPSITGVSADKLSGIKVTVTVINATLSATSPSTVTVPVGTLTSKVTPPTTISAKNGTTPVTLTKDTDFMWTTSAAYSETAAGIYTYTATLTGTAAQNYTLSNYKYVVKSESTCDLTAYSFKTVIEGDDDYFDLGTTLNNEFYAQIKALTGINSPSVSIAYSDLDLGTVSSTGRFTVDLTDSEEKSLEKDGYLTDQITCTATVSGTTYSCEVTLTLYSSDVTKDFQKSAGTLSGVASDLSTRLNALYGSGLSYVYIEDIELDGGTLYTDSTCAETVEVEEDYTDTKFAQMYYVPDGSGETTVIKFTASAGSSSNSFSGYIYLESDEYMIISKQITTEETLAFSAEEFEEAFLALDKDYESLYSIKLTSGIPNSKTAGYVYYDGDTKVTSGTFYVESTKTSEKLIDDLSFVPGTKGGVHTISFTATGYKENSKKATVTGVLQITVVESADITINAAKGQEVSLDLDLFEDFFKDNVSSSKKNYVITHIVFEDAPHSNTAGYLYAGSKKLTSPNGKEFAVDADYDGDYDFDDLTYMGGSKDTSTRATFTIYGKKSESAKNSSATKLVAGTIDFVTGVAGASTGKDLTATLTASQTMPFADEINAFLKLQSDMDYMVFTDLPRTGKLVYNWGASGQTDVTANTAYYISGTNKLLLKNVTFVPGYTSSKSSNTVTFGYKAVSTKGKTVTGTFTITVSHAYVSAQFYDVTNYLYADSVDFLYNQKITTGTSATTFNPNGQVTRMEFVTFLYRAAGSPSVTGLTNKFTDVSATTHSYYYNAILWATANGITTGTSATTFNPTGVVRHDELLTFLYRYDVNYLRHSSTTGSLGSYSGWSSVASWAQTGAKWAAGKGILTDSTTPPASNGTRATVALWMHRMLTL